MNKNQVTCVTLQYFDGEYLVMFYRGDDKHCYAKVNCHSDRLNELWQLLDLNPKWECMAHAGIYPFIMYQRKVIS